MPVHAVDGKDEPVTVWFGMADAGDYFAHRTANEARSFRRNMPATFSPQPAGGAV